MNLSPNPQQLAEQRKKKQKQTSILIALALLGGIGYFFFGFLPEERNRAKEEIEETLKEKYLVSVDKLDKNLWAESENWEEYLDNLYLPSQVKTFKEKMIRGIETKMEELEEEERDRPRREREKALQEIKNSLEESERESSEIQEFLRKFEEQINHTPINDLSSVISKANNFILEKRYKRKRLYWKLPAYNWAEKWLARNQQSLDGVWDKMTIKRKDGTKIEPSYFDAKAIYRIQFPPSLWNSLTEEQKQLAQQNGHGELTLRAEVQNYKFSSLIEEWEQKVKPNPVRGELDPNDLSNLDNNALFYGAPRTGKSVMAEKLAYEADKYPLVTIQGPTLTTKKIQKDIGIDLLLKFFFTISSITYDLVDDYSFEREADGEVRYILFIDEADQACTTDSLNPKDVSAQLTFLKECMGSDNKDEETKNLWIAATNHLDNINMAVYQSGRLSNPLCFSWTLGEFKNYASDAGISSQFPSHWVEESVLKDEDNEWVNRFNKIIFDKDFLPFWDKFVGGNPNGEYEPESDDQSNQQNNPSNTPPKKIKIKWGEFFEFFWRLYDSKQLDNFSGKFIPPRQPKIEDSLASMEQTMKLTANKISEDISKALDARLRELNQSANQTCVRITTNQTVAANNISRNLEEIKNRLAQIGQNMGGRNL